MKRMKRNGGVTRNGGMSRWDAWTVHLSTLLVGGTGLVYAWMRYLCEPRDAYAVVNHPWQPALQHLHVWSAPLLVFGAGVIWRQHVWQHWRRGIRTARRSGLTLMLSLAPMLASGYLIQTAVSPAWRTAWVAIHLTTSGVWIAGYLAHFAAQVRRRRSVRPPDRIALHGRLEASAADGEP